MWNETMAVFAGALALGLLDGIKPAHGWLVAAAYGLSRPRPLAAGLLAAMVIGLGHFLSSVVIVLVFLGAANWLAPGDLRWMPLVSGGFLIALGLWQLHHLRHGHGTRSAPGGRGADAGLWALLGMAVALGFTHQEEVQILGICGGSGLCLQLMLAYALAVLGVLVAGTLLVIAGVERWRARLARWAPYVPAVSAAVLIAIGLWFVLGAL